MTGASHAPERRQCAPRSRRGLLTQREGRRSAFGIPIADSARPRTVSPRQTAARRSATHGGTGCQEGRMSWPDGPAVCVSGWRSGCCAGFLAAAGLGGEPFGYGWRSPRSVRLCASCSSSASTSGEADRTGYGAACGGSADARQLPILDQTALMASSAAFVRLGRGVRGSARRWMQTRAGSAVGNGGTATRMRCHARSAAPDPGRDAQISWRALTRSGSGEL